MDDDSETQHGDEHGGHDEWEWPDLLSTAPPQDDSWPDAETSTGYHSFYFDISDDVFDDDFYSYNSGDDIDGDDDDDDGDDHEMDAASMADSFGQGFFGAAPAAKEAVRALRVEKYEAEKDGRRVTGGGTAKPTWTMCVVCQEKLVEGVDVACMPCSHQFHADCLFPWLDRSRFCPICRFELPREEGWTSG